MALIYKPMGFNILRVFWCRVDTPAVRTELVCVFEVACTALVSRSHQQLLQDKSESLISPLLSKHGRTGQIAAPQINTSGSPSLKRSPAKQGATCSSQLSTSHSVTSFWRHDLFRICFCLELSRNSSACFSRPPRTCASVYFIISSERSSLVSVWCRWTGHKLVTGAACMYTLCSN